MDRTFDGPLSLGAQTFMIDNCVLTSLSTAGLRSVLGELDAERAKYTLAHELAHVVAENPLVAVANNQGGMASAATSALVALLSLTSPVAPIDFSSIFADLGPVPAPTLEIPSTWPLPDAGLPPWRSGVLPRLGFTASPMSDAVASTVTEAVLSVTPASIATLPREEVLRFVQYVARCIAAIAAVAIRQIDRVRAAVSTEFARRVAMLAWNPGAHTVVLIILAICRRYGRSTESDDHAFLPMPRYQTSRGVAAACA